MITNFFKKIKNCKKKKNTGSTTKERQRLCFMFNYLGTICIQGLEHMYHPNSVTPSPLQPRKLNKITHTKSASVIHVIEHKVQFKTIFKTGIRRNETEIFYLNNGKE